MDQNPKSEVKFPVAPTGGGWNETPAVPAQATNGTPIENSGQFAPQPMSEVPTQSVAPSTEQPSSFPVPPTEVPVQAEPAVTFPTATPEAVPPPATQIPSEPLTNGIPDQLKGFIPTQAPSTQSSTTELPGPVPGVTDEPPAPDLNSAAAFPTPEQAPNLSSASSPDTSMTNSSAIPSTPDMPGAIPQPPSNEITQPAVDASPTSTEVPVTSSEPAPTPDSPLPLSADPVSTASETPAAQSGSGGNNATPESVWKRAFDKAEGTQTPPTQAPSQAAETSLGNPSNGDVKPVDGNVTSETNMNNKDTAEVSSKPDSLPNPISFSEFFNNRNKDQFTRLTEIAQEKRDLYQRIKELDNEERTITDKLNHDQEIAQEFQKFPDMMNWVEAYARYKEDRAKAA